MKLFSTSSLEIPNILRNIIIKLVPKIVFWLEIETLLKKLVMLEKNLELLQVVREDADG